MCELATRSPLDPEAGEISTVVSAEVWVSWDSRILSLSLSPPPFPHLLPHLLDRTTTLLAARLPLLRLLAVALLLGRHVLLLPLALLLLLLDLGLFGALLLGHALLGLLAEEVLAGLDLQIHLALFGRGREGRVVLLGLVVDDVRDAALGQRALLEVGQVARPVFVGEVGVLSEFALDPVFVCQLTVVGWVADASVLAQKMVLLTSTP